MTIATRDWLALSELLDTALTLPPEDRATWVGNLGEERAHLKGLLLDLLSREDLQSTRGFLSTLPPLTSSAPRSPTGCAAGDIVGPYRLERQLGAGGMSTVWLAERTDGVLKRKIALKLPHADSAVPGLIERMGGERDILASLEHSNIARLYDAGVGSDGRPYLALEFVEGEPIDAYARKHALDIPARLRLVLQVAQAVAYAHAHLVVHRDIKPSNIQVDAAGVVHLLDFGIAKLLGQDATSQSALTRMAGHLLTPEYASPEQLLGEPVSTASDVYSLGVVLYELLAGVRPHSASKLNAAALITAILTNEPPRPSEVAKDRAVRRRLKGDLDTIALKALKKSPSERYATVAAFAEDIERHMRGEPVRAQPDSRWYRTRKFVARNKLAVGAASGLVIALAAGLGVSLWQVHVARIEKQRADDVKEFITSIFQGADPYFGGHSDTTAPELLKYAKTRIDKELAGQPASAVELLTIVGESLENLDQDDAAEQALTEALDRARKELPPGDSALAQARAKLRLANIRVHQSRNEEARALEEQALPELRRHMPETARDLGNALDAISFQETFNASDHAAAARDGEESVAVLRQAFGDKNSETILAQRDLAQAYQATGNIDKASSAAEQAYQSARALYEPGAHNGLLAATEDLYGRTLSEKGRLEEGIAHLQHAIEEDNTVYGENSNEAGYVYGYLARAHLRLGDFKVAVEDVRHELVAAEKAFDKDSSTDLVRVQVGKVARALTLARQPPQEALDLCANVSPIAMKKMPADDPATYECGAIQGLAFAYSVHLPEARATLTANIAEMRAAKNPLLVESLNDMGLVAALERNWTDSIAWHRQALDSLTTEGDAAPRATALAGIGHAQLALEQLSQAEATLKQSGEMLDRLYKHLTPVRADVLQYSGELRLAQNRAAEALPLFERARSYWNDLAPGSPWAREAEAATRRAQVAQRETSR